HQLPFGSLEPGSAISWGRKSATGLAGAHRIAPSGVPLAISLRVQALQMIPGSRQLAALPLILSTPTGIRHFSDWPPKQLGFPSGIAASPFQRINIPTSGCRFAHTMTAPRAAFGWFPRP